MKALVIDDEPLVRLHLRSMLEAKSVEVVGDCSTVIEGLTLAEDLTPDIIFLDFLIPGMTGLQMVAALQSLDRVPFTILVMAGNENPVAALEFSTLEYLSTPISLEGLESALERAGTRVAEISMRDSVGNAASEQSLAMDDDAFIQNLTTLAHLPIREGSSVRLLLLEEVICAITRQNRVFVRTRDGDFKTYYSLTQLEALLPADRFLRIHDTCIVQLELVRELHNLGSNSYSVRLSDGYFTPVSRSQYRELQIRVGITPAV